MLNTLMLRFFPSLVGMGLLIAAGACGGLIEETSLDDEGADGLPGEDDDDGAPTGFIPPPPTGTGAAWGIGGGRSTGGTAGETGGGGSTGGSIDPGSGGELNAENVDCTGDFGESELLFRDEGWIPQALSPTRDGLEFFYARSALDASVDDSGQRRFAMRSRRSLDEPYSDPIPLTYLDDVCDAVEPGTEPSALDVSGDALRLYIGCNAFGGDSYFGPLLLATRPDRGSVFEVQATPIGQAGISLGLTKDELEGFGSSLDPAVPQILHYTRDSMNEPFSEGVPVAGGIELLNPEPAPDGLFMLGVLSLSNPPVTRIAWSVRAWKGQPFSTPSTEGMPEPGERTYDYSPALTANCREIYFLRTITSPVYDAMVMVARR